MIRERRARWPGVGSGARPGAEDVRLILIFAAIYTLAAFLARRSMLPGGAVSLVWPAAGVSVVWLIVRGGRPWPWLDLLALAATTLGVVAVTGSGALPGLIGAAAATVQAVACTALVARTCPSVWAGHSLRPVAVGELWWFVTAAVVGATLSAPLAALAVTVATGVWSWDVVLLWIARNVVAIITVGTLWFVVADWVIRRRAARSDHAVMPTALHPSARPGPHRALLWSLGLLVAPAVYVAWFFVLDEFTLVFPLIAVTVWLGSRATSGLVTLHNTAVGTAVIILTMHGNGPFAQVDSATSQVAVAQLYVGLTSVIGLSLALARDERLRLLHELGLARDRAESQAALLSTIVEAMAEGVRVVRPDGHVLVRNPAATRLLTGLSRLPLNDAADLAGIRHLDGSPVAEQDLPFRRALAGQTVRDLELLVQTPGTPTPRIVAFTSARIPAESGGGVVTVLRDVTAERDQLRRAAQVQAGLLPAEAPHLPGWEVAARFVPAGSVGGDFYDWEVVGGGLVVTLADVMGKGAGAAILAATTRSVLQSRGAGDDVAGALTAAEQTMAGDLTTVGAFVTAFRAHLDASTGVLTYADAGHGLTFIVRADGSTTRLAATGLPLGVSPGEERTAAIERLGPGDLLLTFSDGVLDAAGGSLRDLSRLTEAVSRTRGADDAVSAVLALAESTTQEDDLTVVAVRRAG